MWTLQIGRDAMNALPPLFSWSSQKPGHVGGADVKVEVDWGVFLDIEGEVTPYRVIMEAEVCNSDLVQMVKRFLDYMIS